MTTHQTRGHRSVSVSSVFSCRCGGALRLFLLSFLILFLEVVLIRWVSTEIRVFAYIKNLPLLASFLGIGVGSLLAGRRPRLTLGAASLLALIALVAFSGPLGLTNLIFPGTNYAVWGARAIPDAAYAWELTRFTVTVVVVTGLVVLTFVALGQELGRLMNQLPALAAYQWNILGSLLGVVCFGLISSVQAAPVWWMAVVVALWAPLWRGQSGRQELFSAACCLLLLPIAYAGGRGAIWSPYYRLDVREIPASHSGVPEPERAGYYVDVNHDYHQKMVNLGADFRARHASPFLAAHGLVYDLPYQFARPGRTLVVGAGTGNDVAAALRAGAEQVTAVEIDPLILGLGRRAHPERPYDSERVRVVNDDARHFFHTTPGRFDTIVFGHLDSHTMLSSMSSVRLDNFVYTRESLEEAYGLLREGGVMVLSFAGGLSFPTERIHRMLAQVAGREPLVFKTDYDSAGMSLVVARGDRTLETPPALAGLAYRLAPGAIREATDDWPYLYLKTPSVPLAYLWTFGVLGLAGALAWFIARRERGRGRGGVDWPMLLLGAGFMLLETKGITSLSLFYGSTWVVNSVVIGVILLAIFVANLTVMKFPRAPLVPAFAVLTGALLLNYWLRLEQFVSYGWWARTLFAALLLGVPIWCAGVVFSRLFGARERRDLALGWNLVGAMIGGLVENASMIWGLNLLNLAAAACYLAVALILWRAVAVAGQRRMAHG